jgi:hypothetical protein
MANPIKPSPGDPDPTQEVRFVLPQLTELTGFSGGAGIRADSEQQQQQQQQQQQNSTRRRFLNLETQLPEEEIVTRLTTEVRQLNRLVKPGGK